MDINEKYFVGFEHRIIDTGEVKIHAWCGGTGHEAVLLLHGHPESHLTWYAVAPRLAERYRVVIPDMRGYGESSKPHGLPDHSTYSKRAMARDQVFVMEKLGYQKFHIAGHDRGGRVCHRMMLDYPEKIKSCLMLDIIPTLDVYNRTDREIATKYWHWFFYIQPEPFPETFLGAEPAYFIRSNIRKKTIPGTIGKQQFPEDIVREYIRYYSEPATVHAIAEDYRASATIDWNLDMADLGRTIQTPICCLWGSNGNICRYWDVLGIWKKLANHVTGYGIPGCGHFVPEEKPETVIQELEKMIEANR